MKNLKPAIVDGEVVEDYFVCLEGNLWSTKRGYPKMLQPTFGGNVPYPKVIFMINGTRKDIRLHRVVCETFHKFPKPENIPHSEWSRTPESVKMLLRSLYQVNHIDHNHLNHHPSNLEWVTVKQNQQKYQQHRRSV